MFSLYPQPSPKEHRLASTFSDSGVAHLAACFSLFVPHHSSSSNYHRHRYIIGCADEALLGYHPS